MRILSIMTLTVLAAACGKPTADSSVAAAADQAPFAKNDKIVCFDDVSGETSTVKLKSSSPLAAYVRFDGASSRFYAANQVKASYSDYETTLVMARVDGTSETLVLSDSIKSGSGIGLYADGGDSRALDCEMKAGSQEPTSDEYVQILNLDYAATTRLVSAPSTAGSEVPASVLAVAKDPRMKGSFQKLIKNVRKEGDTKELKDLLERTIHLAAYRQGSRVTVYLEGDADDRGDSTWGFIVEFDQSAKKVLTWSAVEFTDHP